MQHNLMISIATSKAVWFITRKELITNVSKHIHNKLLGAIEPNCLLLCFSYTTAEVKNWTSYYFRQNMGFNYLQMSGLDNAC